ncbi:MAG: hypothetical protein GF331_08960 [Chitinivibrionales bacterium]|nr:hypothetical protein [Chitinivibrionales bacterium]
MTREEAIRKLEQYGIEGAEVYLIDIIPLIEMMWADGSIQKTELSLFEDYLERHVERVNRLAGETVLTADCAVGFVRRFLRTRPDPALLRTLRSFIPSLRTDSAEQVNAIKSSLLAACLELAASAPSPMPYADPSTFDPEERKCFFELLDSFRRPPRRASHLYGV